MSSFGRALVLGLALFGLGAVAQEAPARRSVWEGVYSDAQAQRGEAQYNRNCQACHGADLTGDPVKEVPSLAWEGFLTQWNNRTVRDLFETLKRSMPKDDPGSLNARAYVDVIAYLLQVNKFPGGPKDLNLNTEALGQIVIERKK